MILRIGNTVSGNITAICGRRAEWIDGKLAQFNLMVWWKIYIS